MKSRYSPLCRVGTIDLPPAIFEHRFYKEAVAVIQDNQAARAADVDSERLQDYLVTATMNTHRAELYGWLPNVIPHVDNSGYMYLVNLKETGSILHIEGRSIYLRPGQVVRLYDYMQHWTVDKSPVVALFVGCFKEPENEAAIQALREAVAAMASGAYYGAPRMAQSLIRLEKDECLASVDCIDPPTHCLMSDVKAKQLIIERCAKCNGKAIKIDAYWPMFADNNRCRACIEKDD